MKIREKNGPRGWPLCPREPSKAMFLAVIEARNRGGASLARALGSALNGHKWQTNTFVGSGSMKVETSRATLEHRAFLEFVARGGFDI